MGSVTTVDSTHREINIYLNPQATDALSITPDQVVAAVASKNQEVPIGTINNAHQERVIQIQARMKRPEDFGRIIVVSRNGVPVQLEQLARVADGAQEVESLALCNGQRTLLMNVQQSQDENTIVVVNGLQKNAG